MGYPTKIQVIKREQNQQWYVNFPIALAQAMDFDKSEVVEWEIVDKYTLQLKRKSSRGKRDKKGV